MEIYNREGKEGNVVKTLQQLARNSIRETLAASGYDIRPKVQGLELPRALKRELTSFDWYWRKSWTILEESLSRVESTELPEIFQAVKNLWTILEESLTWEESMDLLELNRDVENRTSLGSLTGLRKIFKHLTTTKQSQYNPA